MIPSTRPDHPKPHTHLRGFGWALMACAGWMALGWMALCLACVGSSVPQPPNLDPIDPAAVYASRVERGDVVEVQGAPGAGPVLADIWVWDLETAAPPVVVGTREDGSFEVVLPGATRMVRLQGRLGEDRTAPLDLELSDPPVAIRIPVCIDLPLEVDLGSDREATIALGNDCDTDLTLRARRLRAGHPALTVSGPMTATLSPATSLELRVRASGVATTEDILLIELELDGATLIHPITLITRGGL